MLNRFREGENNDGEFVYDMNEICNLVVGMPELGALVDDMLKDFSEEELMSKKFKVGLTQRPKIRPQEQLKGKKNSKVVYLAVSSRYAVQILEKALFLKLSKKICFARTTLINLYSTDKIFYFILISFEE